MRLPRESLLEERGPRLGHSEATFPLGPVPGVLSTPWLKKDIFFAVPNEVSFTV